MIGEIRIFDYKGNTKELRAYAGKQVLVNKRFSIDEKIEPLTVFSCIAVEDGHNLICLAKQLRKITEDKTDA